MADPTLPPPEGLAALRIPFPPNVVGKLPRKLKSGREIEIDFVGHATVTDRLLSVDPEWTWEFGVDDPTTGKPSKELSIERDERGRAEALWIRLTVLGVTRREVGYVDSAKDEPLKQLVSDALVRASMRFGVALDLWAKDGLESQVDEAAPRRRRPAPGAGPAGETAATTGLMARINALPTNAAKVACRKAIVAEFGQPGEIPADRLAAAEALVATFEAPAPAPAPGLLAAANGHANGNGKAA